MDILPRFYVYVLCRPDGRPFYVGKGKGNRIDNHEAYARRGVKNKCCNIIRKIWRNNSEVVKQKVYTTDDEQAAFAMERSLIAAIGREYLANVTDGGEGALGMKHSAETWVKVQAAKIGKPRSEACKAKIRRNLTGRKRTPEAIKKGADAIRGRAWSNKARESIPASLRTSKPNARGEKHHNSKITEAQAREVFRLRIEEHLSAKVIADRLGIKRGTVGGMLHSPRDWKWLKDELGYIQT